MQVYLYRWEESAPIRELLDELRLDIHFANDKPEDEKGGELILAQVESIYKLVDELTPHRELRTNENGRCIFRDLETGKKYFLISPRRSPDGILWNITPQGLEAGRNGVDLVGNDPPLVF